MRTLPFSKAVREALDRCLEKDPSVYLMGLGAPDPKGIFGTTSGLQEKYGPNRVMDMPTSENAMTGIAVGAALAGMRPVMVHQRLDFAILAMEQIVNQAAKWHYTFAGKAKVPLVIRLIVGRGWGQGPQHSQSLHSWFAHVPGLKVVAPFTPRDAKGLLISAVEDNNPVIFIEHRWLHQAEGEVPEEDYRIPLGQGRVVQEGGDVTIVAVSYMVLEALRAAKHLAEEGIAAEVIDPRTLRPLDSDLILASVRKTGRLIAADTSWKGAGFGAEITALAAERAWGALKAPPERLALADCPVPTTPALSVLCYPAAADIVRAARRAMGRPAENGRALPPVPRDVPDQSFKGPF